MKQLLPRLRYILCILVYSIAGGKRCYRTLASIESKFTKQTTEGPTVALDVGSGPVPKNPFSAASTWGVDVRENSENNVLHADLVHGALPFRDAFFDYVTAHDLIEHIPRVASENGVTVFPFVKLMNDIFRVLKPGGVLFTIQPCFPSKEAFQDPTHVNIMTEDTLNLYFCESAWARIYGFEGSFEMLDDGWIGGKYFAFMRKSSEHPIRDLSYIQK